MSIAHNVRELIKELPAEVDLVAAAKTRSPAEALEAVDAGVKKIGQNYINEAERSYDVIGERADWHFIGRLQRNKIGRIVKIFDIVETLDSVELAEILDRECALANKLMPVLVEINSGQEAQKSGIMAEQVLSFVNRISPLKHIKILGLMTMGPVAENPEAYRPFFRLTRDLFDTLKKLELERVEMRYLSMGMTDSYKVAIEEGANIVRIGSKIFGPRG